MITFIKMLLDLEEDSSKDLFLILLYEKCEAWLKYIMGVEDTSKIPAFDEAVVDLVVAHYNRLGSEGLSSEKIGSLDMKYEEIPASVRTILSSMKRVTFS